MVGTTSWYGKAGKEEAGEGGYVFPKKSEKAHKDSHPREV